MAADAILDEVLADSFAVRPLQTRPLAPLQHGFTHFRLTLRPLWVATTAPTQNKPGQLWVPAEEATGAALPTPVRTILRQFVSG